MSEIGITLCIAFLLDLLLGDPRYRYHPVRLIGGVIEKLERILRSRGADGKGGGILLALGTAGITLLPFFGIDDLLWRIHPALSFIFGLFIVYSCLAIGDLLRHIDPVASALEDGDPDRAAKALALTVGRDVRALDRWGIARAAIETLSENFVDGFLSPVFWYSAGAALFTLWGLRPISGGVGLMLLFKAASTMDSMVGYKNERYLRFGWAGARLDDLMNFLPARISLLFLWLGALAVRAGAREGLAIALRDRLKHESPNSAHPESFVAGALGLRLGGPTVYPEGEKEKPWLGRGDSEATPAHIRKAMKLVRAGAWIAALTVLLSTLT
jgi:adenosylcobinamide-phosphate synthase